MVFQWSLESQAFSIFLLNFFDDHSTLLILSIELRLGQQILHLLNQIRKVLNILRTLLILENLKDVEKPRIIWLLLRMPKRQENQPAYLENQAAISSLGRVSCMQGHDGLEACLKINLILLRGHLLHILLQCLIHWPHGLVQFLNQILNQNSRTDLSLSKFREHVNQLLMW